MDFFGFYGFLAKLLRLLLKVNKVTTGNQKWPKMGQNSIIRSFFAQRAKKALAKGQSPPQELEVGPRSGSYLLVQPIVDCRQPIVDFIQPIVDYRQPTLDCIQLLVDCRQPT